MKKAKKKKRKKYDGKFVRVLVKISFILLLRWLFKFNY